MAISEEQFETWTHQGSVTQSKASYDTVKKVLNDTSSPYSNRSFDIFLQGSYGNDTNVYADSDVDIVICTSSLFYYDIERLSETDKSSFHRQYPGSAKYSLSDFKTDVMAWLREHYGKALKEKKKALFIEGNDNRRDVDVLVCAEHREYFAFPNAEDQRRANGIAFRTTTGTKIKNFPKLHSANCTSRHQATNQRFKPTVRMFKNMRNRMIEDNKIKDDLAPSYFLEGLLYNVPDDNFKSTCQDTFISCVDWLLAADRSKLRCANEMHWLLDDGSPVSWRSVDCDLFLDEVVKYWDGD